MEVMVVDMPYVWDLLPICTIFILHHSNFNKQKKELIEERQSLLRQHEDDSMTDTRVSDSSFLNSQTAFANKERKYTQQEKNDML